MAITVDQTTLGHNHVGSGSSVTLTTTLAVSAGGFVGVIVSWYGTVTLSSVSGGGLTWTVEQQGAGTTDTNTHTAIAWAQAPSGMASSTVLTATMSAGTTDLSISAHSDKGVAGTTPVDVKAGPTNTSSTSWASAAMTLAAGSVVWSAAMATSFGTPTSTPGTGMTERNDFDDADGNAQTACSHIDSGSGGSFTCRGTWSVNNGGVVNAVAFKAAGGGGSSFSQSATDSISISESLGRALALPRAITDTVSIAESLARTVGYPRSATDALTISDSADRSLGRTVTASDSLTISDSADRAAQAFGRAATDTIGLSESLARQVALSRGVTDSLGVTDTATRSAALHPRNVTDTVGVTDNATSNGGGIPASNLITLPLTGAGQ